MPSSGSSSTAVTQRNEAGLNDVIHNELHGHNNDQHCSLGDESFAETNSRFRHCGVYKEAV